MVIVSASIITRSGKVILARQFVEIPRSRIEGLLGTPPSSTPAHTTAAFPKLLVAAGGQHTYVETDAVRYVYTPLESLYVLLVTNRGSNIMEDLRTLKTLAALVTERCRVVEEEEVTRRTFDLVFAFDEVISMGYSEPVSTLQIKTLLAMDSHDERQANEDLKRKQKEAADNAKKRAAQLSQQRQEALRRGQATGGFAGGIAGGGVEESNTGRFNQAPAPSEPVVTMKMAPTRTAAKKLGSGMKLGAKSKAAASSLFAQLAAETESPSGAPALDSHDAGSSLQSVQEESVHVVLDEHLTATLDHEGGLQQLEVKGEARVAVKDEAFSQLHIALVSPTVAGVQFQPHPTKVDKKLFTEESVLGLKEGLRFPATGSPVMVLKWRLGTQDESLIPLSITCWPQPRGGGAGQDVSMEVTLNDMRLSLGPIVVTVPVPGKPSVSSCDGDYSANPREGVLQWRLPALNPSSKSASIEFAVGDDDSAALFPIEVSFSSTSSFTGIDISEVKTVRNEAAIRFSKETTLTVDSYNVV